MPSQGLSQIVIAKGLPSLSKGCLRSADSRLVLAFVWILMRQVLAIKLLTRRALGAAKHSLDRQELKDLVGPVLKLLLECVRGYGQLPTDDQSITPYVFHGS